jgi:DNA-binding NtrC family response regulator
LAAGLGHPFAFCQPASQGLMEMQIESDRQPTMVAPSSPHSQVILLVEDEDVVREITAQVLKSAGYQVLQAASPAEALRLAAEHSARIDLLLTDVVMPERNGIELAEQVHAVRPNLITVFMSGYAQTELFRNPGVRSAMHIQKPFTMKALLAGISQALNDNLGQASLHAASSAAACGPQVLSAGAGYQDPAARSVD